MEYRELGDSEKEVSVICLGTMTFGQQNTEKEAHEQLDYATERGVNFIDTAEMYSIPPGKETQGNTERCIGSWLEKRQDRDKLVIATKATGPNPHFDYLRGGPNFSRAQLREAVEGSLKRLKTDYIDLYQLHWPERSTNYFGVRGVQTVNPEEGTNFQEVLECLYELVVEEKIKHIGISNETPWGMMQFLNAAEMYDLPRIVSIQNPYNLLCRQFESGIAEMSMREQVGLLAYSPMGMGVLAGKYLGGKEPEGARLSLYKHYTRYTAGNCAKATQMYVDIANKHGLKPSQMALAFVNQQAFTTSTIIGATKMEQLVDNIESMYLKLSDEVIQEINAVHELQPDPAV